MNIPPLPSSTSGIPATSAAPGPRANRAGGTAASGPTFATTLADSTAAVSVDTMPASPPAEVLDAIGTADSVWHGLQAGGRAVAFAVDPASGRVTATLRDASGATRPLSGAETLALAGGASIA